MIKISSPAFLDGGNIPSKFTCDGLNINPSLVIDDVPEEAKSLVLMVDDPDAPGGNFNHWIVWNIDPLVRSIPENAIFDGAVTGVNSSEQSGYAGPCPPSGQHRYYFKIFALDTGLDISSNAKKDDIEKSIEGHVIAKGGIMGLYSRSI